MRWKEQSGRRAWEGERGEKMVCTGDEIEWRRGGEGRGEEMRVEGKEGRSMGRREEGTEMKVEGMEWGRSMGRTGGVEKGVGMQEGGKEISLKKYLCSAPRYASMYQSFMQSARKGGPSCAYRYIRMWRSRATSCS